MARNAPTVDAYGQGGFRLSGERHEGSVLIVGDRAGPWPVAAAAEVTLESLRPVLDAGPAEVELLVLGMGAKNAQPARPVREAFLAARIGLEFLDTPAAAQLYNVLTAEGRRVALALISV